MTEFEELLDYWFRTLDREAWFVADAAVDAELGRRFGDLPDRACGGGLASWAATPKGALAQVLVLDQLPRNLFRGTARAFAFDDAALTAAAMAIEQQQDQDLSIDERHFLYLPFEHSERLADQDRAVTLIGALGDAVYTDYAERHRDVIRRFGRFPHRNDVLGRTSTSAECTYVAETDSGF
ncbi:MAG: DUF924 family protein [Pseudomonadota bacterium]